MAPLMSIKIDDIVGTVEKELAEREMSLRNKKGKKRAQGKTSEKKADGTAVLVADDEVWSIPSEDEAFLGAAAANKGKVAKVPKTSPEEDAAAAKKKEERRRSLLWKKRAAMASKCIQSLNSCFSSATQQLEKHAKTPDALGEDIVKGLKDGLTEITKLKEGGLFFWGGVRG